MLGRAAQDLGAPEGQDPARKQEAEYAREEQNHPKRHGHGGKGEGTESQSSLPAPDSSCDTEAATTHPFTLHNTSLTISQTSVSESHFSIHVSSEWTARSLT